MEQHTIKVTAKGRNLLRLVAALTGEKHYAVLDRLLEQEQQRLQKSKA